MRRRYMLFVPAMIFATIGTLPSAAHGDGVKFPATAVPAMPTIPLQQAVVVYRDGTETLIISNHFDTDSPEVGWVLPAPHEPTTLAAADPSLLPSLSLVTQPTVAHSLNRLPIVLLGLLIVAAVMALATILTRDKARQQSILWQLLLLFVLAMLLMAILLPSLKTARLRNRTSVTVLSTQQVGRYDAHVLKADSSDALADWLTKQGLKTLDAAGRKITDDYIARGWCFIVATLRRDGGGPGVDHPIAVTFPIDKPVYPMKMTQLAGSTTRVELFVIADQQAAAEGFRDVLAYRYQCAESDIGTVWHSDAPDTVIANPDAGTLMWPNCILTRLQADLTPEQMDRDIVIGFRPLTAHRDHVFSAKWRSELIQCTICLGLIIIMPVLATIYKGRRRPYRAEPLFLLGMIAVIAITAGLTYWLVPVVPVTENVHPFRQIIHQRNEFHSLVLNMAEDQEWESNVDLKDPNQLRALALKYNQSEKMFTNPFTGQPIRHRRSPGDYFIRDIDGERLLCVYSLTGMEFSMPTPDISPATAPAKPD